jgi:hypothetical protein
MILYKIIKELLLIYYIKKFRKYYTDISELPLYNFSKILKGEYQYLYHKPKGRYSRIYFAKIFQEMNFQFKKLDNTRLRLIADAADFKSKYARTKDKRWLNEYETLIAKIEKLKQADFNLDEFTDYIERTFNIPPASIDTKKISTQKAFMNFEKAKAINQEIKQHGNN